ncbi:hypothetical protein PSV08DRAFT_250842 [Bipolaris maydis]|uniref:uncharacterized protein n=1 Tax=Cochliobolus heterostrophus TaxID=5016 RepID=UPI0024CEC934|nr:hypothetical protein PSV08DRAFT_250493 [Bipolaris maydis]KAJ6267727.1 hypothetical protein PSV08DRAFT_250842 [Bipolaris maydis]
MKECFRNRRRHISLRNLGEQLYAELENAYPTLRSTERALQRDHPHPNQHDPSSDTPVSSCANKSPIPSPALVELRNHLIAAHPERASSPDIFDMTSEDSKTPNSETYEPQDYKTSVNIISGTVNWGGSSTTACSVDSEPPEGPPEEPLRDCQPVVPGWFKYAHMP